MRHPIRQRMSLQDRRRGVWHAKTSRHEHDTDDHYDPRLTYKLTDTWFWAYIGQWVYDDLGAQGDPHRCFTGQYGMTDESTTSYRGMPANLHSWYRDSVWGELWVDDAENASERAPGWWAETWLLCSRGDNQGFPHWTVRPQSHTNQALNIPSWRQAVTRALQESRPCPRP